MLLFHVAVVWQVMREFETAVRGRLVASKSPRAIRDDVRFRQPATTPSGPAGKISTTDELPGSSVPPRRTRRVVGAVARVHRTSISGLSSILRAADVLRRVSNSRRSAAMLDDHTVGASSFSIHVRLQAVAYGRAGDAPNQQSCLDESTSGRFLVLALHPHRRPVDRVPRRLLATSPGRGGHFVVKSRVVV